MGITRARGVNHDYLFSHEKGSWARAYLVSNQYLRGVCVLYAYEHRQRVLYLALTNYRVRGVLGIHTRILQLTMMVLVSSWFLLTAFMMFTLDIFMMAGFSMAYMTLIQMIKELLNYEPLSVYNQSFCEFDYL